jgi:hypothetical protein
MIRHEVDKANVRISKNGCHAFVSNFSEEDIAIVENSIMTRKFLSSSFDFSTLRFKVY